MLVLTVNAGDDLDFLVAQIEYHLSAGVDHVVVGGVPPSSDAVQDRIQRFAPDEASLEPLTSPSPDSARTQLRRAGVERGAEWLIEGDEDEFWWPRGASLRETLDPVPPRYTTVQALVRIFVSRPVDHGSFEERMIIRPSLLSPKAHPEPLAWALKPVHRVRDGEIVDAVDLRFVPLRSWYPIEVLRFPLRDAAHAAALRARANEPRSTLEAALLAAGGDDKPSHDDVFGDDESLRVGLGDGTLVEDTRLRDYLHALRTGGNPGRTTPTIVDEASHAVECAAVGEVDLAGLDRSIRELEDRIATLEQRFWPRVQRGLIRMSGRHRGRAR